MKNATIFAANTILSLTGGYMLICGDMSGIAVLLLETFVLLVTLAMAD